MNALPQLPLHDGGVLAGIDRTLVRDLAAVDPVLQHVEQGAAPEGPPRLADHPFRPQPLLEEADGSERQVVRIDAAHRRGLGLVDDELAVAHVVAERHGAAHPHALALGGGDLVADALAGDLALELGEGEQHVQRQPAHAGGGVELLGHRDEGDARGIEDLDDLGEVGERAGQPVHLVDHHEVEPAGADIAEQALQAGALQRAAREPAVVVAGGQRRPTLVALAADVGLAGLALRMEGVELLLEPLLRGLPGVDRAATDRGAAAAGGDHRASHRRSPPAPLGARLLCRRAGRTVARTSGRR